MGQEFSAWRGVKWNFHRASNIAWHCHLCELRWFRAVMNIETQFPTRLLKAAEVAEILKVSKSNVYKLMAKGEIPRVRIGIKSVRVRPEDLNRYIQEHKAK